MTERAMPCAPGMPLTRASIRIAGRPRVIDSLRFPSGGPRPAAAARPGSGKARTIVHESRPAPAGGPGQAAPIPEQLLKVTSRSLTFIMLFTYLLTRAVII